jgi:hypothetical protein
VDLDLFADCNGSDRLAEIMVAVVDGADAKTLVPLVRISEAFESGWPVGALLTALRTDEGVQGGVLGPVDALYMVVWSESDICGKVHGIFSLAVSQLPVFSEDIVEFLRTADVLLLGAKMSLIDCPATLQALTRLEAAAFLARVDANEFYISQDERIQQYALHQVPAGSEAAPKRYSCLGGQNWPCSFFQGLDLSLDFWTRRGVHLEDVDMALKPVTDMKLLRITKVGNILEMSVPTRGHFFGKFNDELRCITDFLKTVDQKFGLPDFELVLNHGDLPLSRRIFGKPPFYDFKDGDIRTPVPLFSLVTSPHFHDMLFPNVCRPGVGNLTEAAPEFADWASKIEQAFYRGTDRGAINWRQANAPLSKIRSLRKTYEETLTGSGEFINFALLDDDLFNATVVFSNSNFVPFEQSQKWKYVLDMPGNGYSGSLKQKLTSSSAVFIVTRPEQFPEHLPVTEHFYFGMEAFKHYVPVESPQDLIEKVKWARDNDVEVENIKNNANDFMRSFQERSECYLWLLISMYAEGLRFQPELTRTLKGMRHYQVHLGASETDLELNIQKCVESAGYM